MNDADIIEWFDSIQADVYAFSCYVWNTGLIKRLLSSLLARQPEAHIILGGPQVMHKAERYLNPQYENLILCNGEGELTFADYLLHLAANDLDLCKVNGLSFYRNGELITTPKQERMRNLDEIPSPYLEGYFDATQYTWAVLETNRGCPFTCTYCYWGAATNAKVRQYEQDRVFDEITWLSRNGVHCIFIADANFGILKRDVEVAQHIAACKKTYGYPISVYFSSSKNTPQRVTDITVTFDEAGLASAQPISLQTMSDGTLSSIKRSNIKSSSYTELQQVLNERGLSSFIEIIWPLPGETFSSFKAGLGELCRLGADSFLIYPLLLINNVEIDLQREEYNLLTVDEPDPNSEAEVVVATRDVSNAEYLDGLRFAYHLTSLYSVRGLWHVARYLDTEGYLSYEDLISAFAEFSPKWVDNPYTRYIEGIISASEQYRFSSMGGVLHVALHAGCEEFDELLWAFMQSLPFKDDEQVRLRFELDLLNRPHVYRNTPIIDKQKRMQLIRVVETDKKGYVVEIPSTHSDTARRLLNLQEGIGSQKLRVQYKTTQLPYMRGKSIEDNYAYCQDKLHKIGSIMPSWSEIRELASA